MNMNLPELGSIFGKGCKVFALSMLLVSCAACSGGTTDEASNSPVSSEVEISEGAGNSSPAAENGAAPAGEGGEAAVAEDGAAVGGAEASGEAPKPAAKPEEKKPVTPKHVVSKRDPFNNPSVAPSALTATPAGMRNLSPAQRAALKRNMGKVAPRAAAPVATRAPKAVKKVVKVVKPSITVNGIMKNADGSYAAIISDGNNTRLVTSGQRVDKYYVAGINPYAKTVTLGLGREHRFVYTLEKEKFGEAKAAQR